MVIKELKELSDDWLVYMIGIFVINRPTCRFITSILILFQVKRVFLVKYNCDQLRLIDFLLCVGLPIAKRRYIFKVQSY